MKKLTFDYIKKNCKSGEHLLVDNKGKKRLYLGFDRDNECVVTDGAHRVGAGYWFESDIASWIVEPYAPPKQKKTYTWYTHWYLDQYNLLRKVESDNALEYLAELNDKLIRTDKQEFEVEE